jgi:hypothetical protein
MGKDRAVAAAGPGESVMNWAYTVGCGQLFPPDTVMRSYGNPASSWRPDEPLLSAASVALRDHSISGPLDREPATTTLVVIELVSSLGDFRHHLLVDRDAEDRLQAFRDWLASIPAVPHIPADKLGRDELY